MNAAGARALEITIKGLTSEAIIAELVKKPDRPWADWKNGKAITPKALAALLKPFNIVPDRLYLRLTPTPGVTRAMRSTKLSLATFPLSMWRCDGKPATAGTSAPLSMRRRAPFPPHCKTI